MSKKAGHDLESWQQETGLAIAKHLLVVRLEWGCKSRRV